MDKIHFMVLLDGKMTELTHMFCIKRLLLSFAKNCKGSPEMELEKIQLQAVLKEGHSCRRIMAYGYREGLELGQGPPLFWLLY